jgi:signal transduction histidine kinase
MRSIVPGRTLSACLLVVAGLGILASIFRTRAPLPTSGDIQVALQTVQLLGQGLLPVLLIGLGFVAIALVIALTQRSWRHAQRTTYERVWRQAERHACELVLQQVRMLEHAHLKSAVTEAHVLLREAIDAVEPAQQALRLQDVEHSLYRLRRLIVELHSEVAKGVDGDLDGSALPTNLERTLVEVTRNFRKLVPHCTLEVAGHARAAIPEHVRVALEMGLYNALSNAYTHGRAQMVRVRLEYRLTEVVLSIRDNGRGFDVARARQARCGRGLHDLTYFAERQGGTMTITSAIGRGTDLTITVPLERPTLGWAAAPDGVGPPERNDSHEGAFDVAAGTASSLGTGTRAVLITANPAYPGGRRHGDRAGSGERSPPPPWVRGHHG